MRGFILAAYSDTRHFLRFLHDQHRFVCLPHFGISAIITESATLVGESKVTTRARLIHSFFKGRGENGGVAIVTKTAYGVGFVFSAISAIHLSALDVFDSP